MTTATLKDGRKIEFVWTIAAYLGDILRIEEASFPVPWTEHDFKKAMHSKNCLGFTALHHLRATRKHPETFAVAGYFVYLLDRNFLSLINMAVAPEWRRQGVGTACLDKLKSKLSPRGRNTILANASERNEVAHRFLISQGFIGVGIDPEAYESPNGKGQDAYHFEWSLPATTADDLYNSWDMERHYAPVNRLEGYFEPSDNSPDNGAEHNDEEPNS